MHASGNVLWVIPVASTASVFLKLVIKYEYEKCE